MPTTKWWVGQAVTVHFPHANEGAPKYRHSTIVKIGRKFITVDGLTLGFDATSNPPRADYWELYTPEGYLEMMYVRDVIRAWNAQQNNREWPTALILQIGDALGVKRPEHLRDDIDTKLLKT